MPTLFNRKAKITIGPPGGEGLAWRDLRFSFKVEKDDTPTADKGTAQLWNLSGNSIGFVYSPRMRVQVFAGYEGGVLPMLFQGDILEDDTKLGRSGPNIILEVKAKDGGRAWTDSRAFETIEGPVQAQSLLERLGQQMGLKFATFAPDVGDLTYQNFTVAGRIMDAIREIADDLGARVVIQDGELVISKVGSPAFQDVAVLAQSSGLVGTPELTDKGVKATALLNGKIKPRGLVQIESDRVSGLYLVKKVVHSGDLYSGPNWTTKIEGVEV